MTDWSEETEWRDTIEVDGMVYELVGEGDERRAERLGDLIEHERFATAPRIYRINDEFYAQWRPVNEWIELADRLEKEARLYRAAIVAFDAADKERGATCTPK